MKIMNEGEIHPTAIIGDNVKIGKNVTIYPYVVIEGNVVIEKNVTIHSFTNISASPEHKYLPMKENSRVFIGEGSTLFQHTAITMPTVTETFIGKRAFLMGGAHIGHDCKVMDDAIVGGNSIMAGHSILGEGAFLGDTGTLHQWNVVGAYTMIGMGTPVRHNALPFTIVYGSPPIWKNINRVGVGRETSPLKDEMDLINNIMNRPINVKELKLDMDVFSDELKGTKTKEYLDKFLEHVAYQRNLSKTNRGRIVRHG